MKLISCESCGVVLDTDRIEEPDIIAAGIVNTDVAAWYPGDTYKPTTNCPVCQTRIFYHNGETVD